MRRPGDLFVITVNKTTSQVVWSDAHYSTDPAFFRETKGGVFVCNEYRGDIYTQSRSLLMMMPELKERIRWLIPNFRQKSEISGIEEALKIETEHLPKSLVGQTRAAKLTRTGGYDGRPYFIRTGSNSGYAAISLAANMAPKEIVLCGYDMQKDADGRTHYHHGGHENNNNTARAVVSDDVLYGWSRQLAFHAEETAQRRNIEIVNASPASRVDCFTRVDLCEYLLGIDREELFEGNANESRREASIA